MKESVCMCGYDFNDGQRICKTHLMPADECVLVRFHVCKRLESAFGG